MKISIDEGVAAKVDIERVDSGAPKFELVIRGKRDDLLKAKGFAVRIVYKDELWELQESLNFNFFDGLGWKVIPANPQVEEGVVRFVLFRSAGIDANALRCTSILGERLKAHYSVKARNCVSVRIEDVPVGVDEVLVSCVTSSVVVTLDK